MRPVRRIQTDWPGVPRPAGYFLRNKSPWSGAKSTNWHSDIERSAHLLAGRFGLKAFKNVFFTSLSCRACDKHTTSRSSSALRLRNSYTPDLVCVRYSINSDASLHYGVASLDIINANQFSLGRSPFSQVTYILPIRPKWNLCMCMCVVSVLRSKSWNRTVYHSAGTLLNVEDWSLKFRL